MSSSEWSADADNCAHLIAWTPEPPYLGGFEEDVAVVRERLAAADRILVTPTGPSVEADVANPLAVFAIVCREWPGATFTGTPPTLPPIPDDAVA